MIVLVTLYTLQVNMVVLVTIYTLQVNMIVLVTIYTLQVYRDNVQSRASLWVQHGGTMTKVWLTLQPLAWPDMKSRSSTALSSTLGIVFTKNKHWVVILSSGSEWNFFTCLIYTYTEWWWYLEKKLEIFRHAKDRFFHRKTSIRVYTTSTRPGFGRTSFRN